MRLLLGLLLGLLFSLAFVPAASAYDTPQQLLEAFYAPYLNDNIPEDQEQMFSAGLNALYEEDAAASNGEMGAIESDPFIVGQDFAITNFAVGEVFEEGDYGRVEVTFENFGEPQRLFYSVLREADGWKIDDVENVTPGSEYTLTGIFAAAAAR